MIRKDYAYDGQIVKCFYRHNNRDELANFKLVLIDERFTEACNHEWIFYKMNSYHQVFVCSLMCGETKYVRNKS